MHSRRGFLYVPGDDRHKIEKAAALQVDCICLDMEDGVAPDKKLQARSGIAAALREIDFAGSEKLARINAPGTGWETEDLTAALEAHPDGIVVPKVEEPGQLQWAADMVEAAELRHGWPLNSVRLIADVETARGILNVKEISAHPRLDALIFGGEDFAVSIGATRTPEAVELLYGRQTVLTAASAYGLQAIDIVTIDFTDLEALSREAEFGARLGFAGKQIIHPAQVEPVQRAFTPSDSAVRQARRVVEGFEASLKKGKGAYALDGKMIDMPLVRSAENVLERAKAAGRQ
jgi:citrate lyase subunit beta-like protein